MNNETALTKMEPSELTVSGMDKVNSMPMATVTPPNAQELRVLQVSEALTPAYQKAGTLEMSEEEIAALTAPFPDEYVEIRPHDGLIYIPHIHISDRLNQVFKPGKWVLLRRRDWFDQSSSTMFGEYVMIIRGCLVGESIGGHPYVPSNPKTNLSDVLESTAAEALRRICGKRLSCGSQVWNPAYAREWVRKYGVQVRGKWERRFSEPEDHRTPPQAKGDRFYREATSQYQPEPKSSSQAILEPKRATPATRQWMLGNLKLAVFTPAQLKEFVIFKGWNCEVEDWPLDYVPTSQGAIRQLIVEIESFIHAPKEEKVEELPASIADVVFHVPPKGVKLRDYKPQTIGQLYASRHDPDTANRLFGFIEHFEAKGWEKDDGTQMPPSAQDIALRKGLDALRDWLDTQKQTDFIEEIVP